MKEMLNKILIKLTGDDLEYWIKDLKCEVGKDEEDAYG